jgi:hypothetical protein
MSKDKSPEIDATDTNLPEPPTDEAQRAEMRERAVACGKDITEVLNRHRCFIQPYLEPMEHIGNSGTRAVISASYAVLPHE